jgi:hypothetical protein
MFPSTSRAPSGTDDKGTMDLPRNGPRATIATTRYSIRIAELEKGCRAFERHEGRDSMYRVTTFLLEQWWGRHADMVDALTVLLLTWNASFYRYGMFDQHRLEKFLGEQWNVISSFRNRDIASLTAGDHGAIKKLFDGFNAALQIQAGKCRGRRSPVAVAKTLHLLGPRFFPPWDYEIANQYDCDYSEKPANAYTRFCDIVQTIASDLAGRVSPSSKSLLKLIDEFNYAQYTKEWI